MIGIVKKGSMMPVFSLFDDFVDRLTSDEMKYSTHKSESCQMPVDISENENEYKVIANLPGITKENIKISFLKGQMTIETHVKEEKVETEQKVLRRERYCGTYQRSLYLPDNIQADKISAKMDNGVLTVVIPKVENKKQSFITIE